MVSVRPGLKLTSHQLELSKNNYSHSWGPALQCNVPSVSCKFLRHFICSVMLSLFHRLRLRVELVIISDYQEALAQKWEQ